MSTIASLSLPIIDHPRKGRGLGYMTRFRILPPPLKFCTRVDYVGRVATDYKISNYAVTERSQLSSANV